jgi:hypothetical protein
MDLLSFTISQNLIERYAVMSLIERYADKIRGVISCYDRIVIQGVLPGFCYAEGMTSYLYAHQIRIFDYPRFAEPMRDVIRTNAERLAAENGITIEFIRKAHIRKEDIITKVLERRGAHPGLVHILSAMEACQSYKPWHNKTTASGPRAVRDVVEFDELFMGWTMVTRELNRQLAKGIGAFSEETLASGGDNGNSADLDFEKRISASR